MRNSLIISLALLCLAICLFQHGQSELKHLRHLQQMTTTLELPQKTTFFLKAKKTEPIITEKVLGDIIQKIQEARLNLQFLQILPVQSVQGLTILPLKITMQGDAAAFREWVLSLAQYALPVQIMQFSIVQQAEFSQIKLQLAIFYQRMPPLIVKNSAPNPFFNFSKPPLVLTLTKTLSKSVIFSDIPLEKLHYAGFIQNSQAIAGLVISPTGQTQPVIIGDHLGREAALVSQVTSTAVIIAYQNKLQLLQAN